MNIDDMKTMDLISELRQREGAKWLRTSELVDELKCREGVEFVMVGPEDRCEVLVDNESDVCVYDARRQGPEIVLRITD